MNFLTKGLSFTKVNPVQRRAFNSNVQTRSASSEKAYDSLVKTMEEEQDKVFSDLSAETGVQKEYLEDPELHMIVLKTVKVFEKLGLSTETAQNDFLSKYLLSPGHSSLEWVLPSPPPVHTYEELPLIKEHEGVDAGHH